MDSKLPILFDSRAEADADSALQGYAAQQPELAVAFLEVLDHSIEMITSFPYAYPQIIPSVHRFPLRKFPYFVYYRVVEDQFIKVLAILHVRRAPQVWRQRL